LLDAQRIRRDGLIDARWVESCWRDHQGLRADRSRELWAVLMVQSWLDVARKAPSSIAFTAMSDRLIAAPRACAKQGHAILRAGAA
jgi:asparagine synthase (glutamine-hydrolysing)